MASTAQPRGGRAGGASSADRRGSPRCPHCGARRRSGERHCLQCRYEFATGRLPQPPILIPLRRPAMRWEVQVDADDDYALTRHADGAHRPADLPAVVVPLHRNTVVIGHLSGQGDSDQRINLNELTGDPGISEVHAFLVRETDGSYRLVDRGSLNGTHLNSHTKRIALGHPTSLRDGDQIFVGAWTRLTIRQSTH
jgi:FHA domain